MRAAGSAVAQRGLAIADLATVAPEVEAARRALEAIEAGAEQQSWSLLEDEASRLRTAATQAGAGSEIAGMQLAEAAAAFSAAESEHAAAAADVRAAMTRADLASSAVAALTLESETASARIAALQTALAEQVDASHAASRRAQETAADVQAARSAVDAAWESVNAAERAVASAAAHARLALAGLAEARGRMSGIMGEGGIARAVASGSLQARRLVDCVRVPDESIADAVAAALEADLGAWVVEDIRAARDAPRPLRPA